MIYVIRDSLSGHVKIGVSNEPRARFANMQTACPGKLSLRAIIDGERAEEQALHRRFAAQRERGEWFRCEGDLAEWIMSLPALPAASNAPRKHANTWGASGLNDDALALIVGASRAHLCKIRRGKCMPSLSIALQIADATCVDVRSLLVAQPVPARKAAA